MRTKPIIHMLDDHHDGIEGLVGNIYRMSGSTQDAIVEITLSWNRDATCCGPFKVNIGALQEGEERHFDLVLHEDIPLPIPEAIVRIFPDQVGLRPYNGQEKCPDAEILWGDSQQPPCYVVGAGTPYSLRAREPGNLRSNQKHFV